MVQKVLKKKYLNLIHKNGLIIIDNVLWYGKPVRLEEKDTDTIAIRNLNKSIYKDKRVEISMIPVGDGLTIAVKI